MLSLVHRLQRERGATAAWLAGGGAALLQRGPCAIGTGSLVADFRRRTNRLVPAASKAFGSDSIASELQTLREAADGPISAGAQKIDSAHLTFATLSNYSRLVARLLAKALGGAPTLLRVARLKELYAQQRGFLVGLGGISSSVLSSIPPRAIVTILDIIEQQQEICPMITEGTQHLDARLRLRVAASITLDDTSMADLCTWLRSGSFDMATLHERLQQGPMTIDVCWLLWTAHIDKLQALEDLLLGLHCQLLTRRARIRAALACSCVVLLCAVSALLLVHLALPSSLEVTTRSSVLAAANTLLAVAISYGLVVVWRAWRGGLSPAGDCLQSSAMSLSAAICDDEPSRCSRSTGAQVAFDEPSSHSSHSLGTDASSSNASSGEAGTLRLPWSPVGSLDKQAASPDTTVATAAHATRPPRLASIGWESESPVHGTTSPPAAPLPNELYRPTGGPTGRGLGGDPRRVQSDLRALIAEIACDASLPNCEEALPSASLPSCPRNQSPQPPSAPVDFCDGIFRTSFSPSEVAITPLPAGVVDGPRVPALSPCEPLPELPLPPVAGPRVGGGGGDGAGRMPGRTPAKIGLVAHQPASDILQRTEVETLVALLDGPPALRPPALGEHPTQPTPLEQPFLHEAARASSAAGLQTEPSRSSLSSSPPSSPASSPMPSGAPPRRRPPPAPRVSPRLTSAIDPMLDELFDLFDQEHAYLDFTEVKVLGRGSFGQAVLMQAPSGVQVVAKKLPLDACSDGELRRLESEVTVCAWYDEG